MKALAEQIGDIDGVEIYGRVVGVRGLMVEIAGPIHAMSVGARLNVETGIGRMIPCEVVGFSGGHALAMPFASLDGVRRGCRAVVSTAAGAVRPSESWLGRVVNALGEPIDGLGPLAPGPAPYSFRNSPPPAHARRRVGEPLDLGVRALNTFITCCRGQRMGIFAGSGVGKSVLLSMMARNVNADVSVIGLVGERGREVQEFLQDDLGPEGLARSVVVVSTSDEPALMRRQAAYLTLAIAEFFRDLQKDVLVLMDSVTRFAMAQREIGLSAGEPPTAKGYTPTVFTELPRLLERAGPGTDEGTITGIFTVLVDGDDHNEPVADAVRGILDGHIVMERAIAERGRYPAINILKSISRTMPKAADPAFLPVITRAKQVMATYADMEELIRLGAYRPGSSPDVDEAIGFNKPLETFLGQRKDESTTLAEGYQRLERILSGLETEN
ncbi:flagellar protein export ATPase FliI [Pseudolabrys taiwanensis]|uniref:Flagellum-specific ATP synthase n=1 Tax=Pseudolabrys taiwanensis TaxID=331696 RepID=A0A345ZW72_9HYPH|nr:flagellar protein export ATPase FliI [Pseudolabrys taiwanensis]AXK81169.1 flagellar protein export ATPase FliI [Pseudolabrys taiwanensis]